MAATKTGYAYNDSFEITKQMKDEYDKKGYIIVRNLFSKEEISKVHKFIIDKEFLKRRYYNVDGETEKIGMVIWNHPGDDLTGWVARCHRVVDTAEKLLEGEAYHYHTKLVLKEAKTGGAFHWHQDYGYWYENGCMFPNMLTVFIALDAADKENGCVQILEGSHQLGRIQHIATPSQVTADADRLEWAKQLFPLVYLELQPGDACFFHCNLLHTSAPNKSTRNRYAMLTAYNRMDNDPMMGHHHPRVTKLEKVPDKIILEGESPEVDWKGKDFILPGFKHVALDNVKSREH